jgi:hypothetical protein
VSEFPSEAFNFTELGVKEVLSTARVLAAVGDTWVQRFVRKWKDFLHG